MTPKQETCEHTQWAGTFCFDCGATEVAIAIRAAVEKEREECAKVAEACVPAFKCLPWSDAQRNIAEQIRSRSERKDGEG